MIKSVENTNGNSRLVSQVYVPLAIVLFLIAVVNSIQNYYFGGHRADVTLLDIFISKLFYLYYYLALSACIQALSKRVHFSRTVLIRWVCVHCTLLVVSFILHQIFSHAVDSIVLNVQRSRTLYNLVMNNPAAWLDVMAYGLFLLTFSLIEYQSISHANEIRYAQLEVELLKSKLSQLRSMIHPYFLFNTLQSISQLLDVDQNKEANSILTQMSNYLRTTLYDNDREEVLLKEEMEYLHQYIAIERIRFPIGLRLYEEQEEGLENTLVPNIILQPIVENMIDSNCGGNATNRPCNIHLRIHKVKDQVHFIVEVGSDLDAPKQDISIDNNVLVPLCKERLQRLYHLRHEFFVKRSDDGNGVIVEMHIPFHTQPIKYSSTLLEETFK